VSTLRSGVRLAALPLLAARPSRPDPAPVACSSRRRDPALLTSRPRR
jgi:hypothetical protein